MSEGGESGEGRRKRGGGERGKVEWGRRDGRERGRREGKSSTVVIHTDTEVN